jgi:hypothetical protein
MKRQQVSALLLQVAPFLPAACPQMDRPKGAGGADTPEESEEIFGVVGRCDEVPNILALLANLILQQSFVMVSVDEVPEEGTGGGEWLLLRLVNLSTYKRCKAALHAVDERKGVSQELVDVCFGRCEPRFDTRPFSDHVTHPLSTPCPTSHRVFYTFCYSCPFATRLR